MRTIKILTFLLLATSHLFASNISVSGDISTNTVWSVDTVFVTDTVTVLDGITLTINPGTLVLFQGYYPLKVNGRLLAIGTESNKITFTVEDTTYFWHTNDELGAWHGIRFNNVPITNDTSKIIHCILKYSKALIGDQDNTSGGAIFISKSSKIIISDCEITKTKASYGGAIYIRESDPIIRNNIIHNVWGRTMGGAICIYNANPKIINNLIHSNSTQTYGGGICLNSNSRPEIINNTICNNTASRGGGIFVANSSSPNIKNTIIWGNTASFDGNQVHLYTNNADPNFYYCDIQGDSTEFGKDNGAIFNGDYENNINADPRFISSNVLSLQNTSPCINKGNPQHTIDSIGTAVDLNNNPRIFDGIFDIVDIGAYEYQGNPSVIEFCGTIDEDMLWDCDSVKINCNVIINDGKTLTISPSVFIEFQGHYSFHVQGRILALGTVNDSIYFTIKDTTGFANKSIPNGGWAGIIFQSTNNSNDSSKFFYCHFQYGKASGVYNDGGVFYISQFSKIFISNCLFIDNIAFNYGGVMYLNDSRPLIKYSTFKNNKGDFGGAIYGYNLASPTIWNCFFTDNYANDRGGAITLYFNCYPELINCCINNNLAWKDGGGIYLSNSQPRILNCNVVYNNAYGYNGGGMYFAHSSSPDIENTILWGNEAGISGSGDQVYISHNESDPGFFYCDVQGGTTEFKGAGSGANYSGAFLNSIVLNPFFKDTTNQNYQLKSNSPCINAGDPTTDPNYVGSIDLANNTRIINSIIDIGCYERQAILELNIKLFLQGAYR
ncbi:MAG: hypothetical protein JW866_02910 [Ignavibacteriales bacterium]|nr:hypothetical protein [Ignavibacteriales bacterium]